MASKSNIENKRALFAAYMAVVNYVETRQGKEDMFDKLTDAARLVTGDDSISRVDDYDFGVVISSVILKSTVNREGDCKRKLLSVGSLKKALYNLSRLSVTDVEYKAPADPDAKKVSREKSQKINAPLTPEQYALIPEFLRGFFCIPDGVKISA